MGDVYGQVSKPEGVPGSTSVKYEPSPNRVKCGQFGALLAVPENAPRFACSNCGALLASPNFPQVANPAVPIAEIKIVQDDGTKKNGDDNDGGNDALPKPPEEVP